MNSNKQLNLLLSIMAAALCGAFCHTHAGSMGTAFTYQGRLVTSTGPASGSYELMFSLWDNQYYGTLIGTNTTCSPCSVTVTGGVFSVLLDFGPVFQGDLRWLEIAARPTGGSYVVLPRQPLTPAPNALYAARADAVSGLSVTSTPLEVQGERVDQSQSTGGSGLLSDASTIVWQSFTAGWSAGLVKVNVTVSGNTEAGMFSLYDGEGIWAGGDFKVPLWSDEAALDGHQVIPGGGWPLVAGHKYTFAFWYPAGASLAASTGDTYAGGTAGVMQSPNAGDLAFTNVMSSYFIPNYQLGLGLEPDTAGTLSVNGPVTATTFAGTFTGNGGTLTNLRASSLTGTLADAQLSPNVALLNANQAFTGTNRFAGPVVATNTANQINGTFTGNGVGLTNLTLPGLTTTSTPLEVQGERVDQSQNTGGSGLLSDGSTIVWQSFTAGWSARLAKVNVTVSGDTDAGTFSLYDGEGIWEGGDFKNPLWSDTAALDGHQVIPGSGWPLVAGHKYTFAFWYPFGASLSASAGDTYAGGTAGVMQSPNAGDLVFTNVMSSYFIPNYQLGLGLQPDTAGTLSVNGPVTATTFTGNGAGLTSVTPADGSVTAAKLASDASSLSKVSGGLMGNYSGNVGIGTNNPQYMLHVNGEAGVTALNITCDRNAKEQFTTVEARAVLDKVLRLPITSWQFKDQPGVRHLGPVAQDFHAAFALGRDDTHIATVDADGVGLAAIQGLNEKLEEQLKQKDAELERVKAENQSLAGRLSAIEQALGLLKASAPASK